MRDNASTSISEREALADETRTRLAPPSGDRAPTRVEPARTGDDPAELPRPARAQRSSVFASRIALIYIVVYAGRWLVGFVPGINVLGVWWSSGLDAVSRWTLRHLVGLSEHSPPVPSWYDHRPDDLIPLVGCLLVAAVAIIAAAAWTIIRPQRSRWEKSPSWPYVVARFALAGIMFSYAWAKLFPQQFNGGQVPLSWLLWRLGDFSPQHLLWIFMGYSRPYAIFAGAGEMLGALLLCFRRTAAAGAFVLIAVLSNIVVMNFAYDVPVKVDAVNFLLMALFIAAPDARRIARAILHTQRPDPTRLTAYLRTIRGGWIPRVAGASLTLWLLLSPLSSVSENIDGLYFSRRPLARHAGIFEMPREISGGDSRAADQPWADWRRVAITSGSATVLTAGDSLLRYRLTTDTLTQRMRLTRSVGADRVLEFDYVLSDSTVTLRSVDGGRITLRRTEPTLLRWKHLWAW